MKRGIKTRIFALLLALCATLSFVCGCADGGGSLIEVTLVGWQDEQTTASYGSEYTLESYALSDNGKAYTAKATVKDSRGNAVAVSFNKFTVLDYGGYTVEYVAALNGKTYMRTVSIEVTAAAPMLRVEGQMEAFIDETVILPVPEVTDYIDGTIESYQTEVYNRADGGDEKQAYDTEAGTFTPSTAGDYYVVYTTVNSQGVLGRATTSINVKDPTDYLPYVVKITQENKNQVYYEGNAGRTSFVKATTDELKIMEGEYTGNAIRFNAQYGYDGQFRVKNIYSRATLEKLKQTYRYVSLWTAYNIVQDPKEARTIGELYFLDVNTSTNTKYTTFWTKANRLGTYYAEGNQVWQKLTITIDEYASLVEANGYKYFVLFCLANRHDKLDELNSGIYVGDIVFEESLQIPEPLRCNGLTYANYTYNGNSKDYTTYYTAAELSEMGFTGGYTGNAVAYKILGGHSGQYRVNNTLTAEMLAAKKAEGFDAVSLWVAYDLPLTDPTSNAYCINFFGQNSIFAKAGIIGTKKAEALSGKVWRKVSISIDDYAALIAENPSYVVLFYCGDRQAILDPAARIYVGDIVFDNLN
ncbi:MAG: hypothetical protein IJX81_04640 [Clostridia bacterium]|nr:hypothetical protein [Clostridia bacterium]